MGARPNFDCTDRSKVDLDLRVVLGGQIDHALAEAPRRMDRDRDLLEALRQREPMVVEDLVAR